MEIEGKFHLILLRAGGRWPVAGAWWPVAGGRWPVAGVSAIVRHVSSATNEVACTPVADESPIASPVLN